MLARDDLHAVSLCVPSGLRADLAESVARAGKHVMSEKPLEITTARVDRILRACDKAGVLLGCIFQYRFAEAAQHLRKALDQGRFGKLVLGDAYIKWYRSQAYYDSGAWRGTWKLDGGGALMNQGVHMIDILRWIMGPVDTVFGFADHLARKIEVEDTCTACMRFKSGAFGTLEGTTSVTPGMHHRLELHGEKGSILVDGEKLVRWDVPGEDKDEVLAGLQDEVGSAASDPTAIGMEGHRQQIADLIAAIKEDREPMVNGKEARNAVELILAIYRSAKTGQPVKL
jgi:predicted dehydrogenase